MTREERLEIAKRQIPRLAQRRTMMIEHFNAYFPVLLAAEVLIDRTGDPEYNKGFRRCIPFKSHYERGFTNTISLLIEDTRNRGKLFHVFGGQCGMTVIRHVVKSKVLQENVPLSRWEIYHSGRGQYRHWTKWSVIAEEHYHDYYLMAKEKAYKIWTLRPLFPPGVYFDHQVSPLDNPADIIRAIQALVETPQ